MDLQSLLNGPTGQQLIGGLSEQLGIDNKNVSSAVSMAVPLLLSQMDKNTNSPDGASSLANALESHSTNDLMGSITNILNSPNMADGLGILGHVFGGKQTNVTQNISKQSGVSSGNVMQIMATVAPLVMSYLGNQKSQNGLDANGISGLLSNLVGNVSQSNQSEMSVIEKMLDSNNDGSVVDDVMDLGSKFLGGFFK